MNLEQLVVPESKEILESAMMRVCQRDVGAKLKRFQWPKEDHLSNKIKNK